MHEHTRQSLKTLIIAATLGLGSGVIATALTSRYLSGYALTFGDLSSPARLSEERPRSSPQTYAEALSKVTDSVLPGVARVYVSGSYAAPVASGAMLTSDGWLVAFLDRPLAAAGLSVAVGGHAYAVEKMEMDTATGATFIKIAADNLPVFAFGSGFDVMPGDQLFIVPSPTAVFAETAVEARRPSGPLSSDVPSRRIAIDNPLLGERVGAPVVNVRGDLVGIVASGGAGFTDVLPVDGLLPAFNEILRGGTVERASLGVSSTDIGRTLGLLEKDTGGRSQGALLLGAASVRKGSVAAAAGLVPGDIILAVDGVPVDARRTLDELIVTHLPGEEVALKVATQREEREVRVVLGAL